MTSPVSSLLKTVTSSQTAMTSPLTVVTSSLTAVRRFVASVATVVVLVAHDLIGDALTVVTVELTAGAGGLRRHCSKNDVMCDCEIPIQL